MIHPLFAGFDEGHNMQRVAEALHHIELAIESLKDRTRERDRAGVAK